MLPAPLKRLLAQPSHRWALLAVLGLAAVVTPLAEVWRRQGLELQTAFDARSALQSVAAGLQTQRALSAHRPYAAAVLAGRDQQEPERLRRQQAVDSEVGTLVATLEAQRLHRALDEADQLRNEWTNLLEGIGRRKMPAAASDAAHDLLIEQVFVIMDLTAGAGGLQGQVGRAVRGEAWTLAMQTLPRLAADLARWPDDAALSADPSGANPGTLAQARRAAKAATDLLTTLDATGADEPAPDPAIVHALVALQQSATHLATPTSAGPSPAAVVRRAHAASVEAHHALIAHLDAGLVQATSVLRLERLVVAAAGLLALVIAAFAGAMVLPRRETSPSEGAAVPDSSSDEASATALHAATVPGGAESQGPASDLLLRLRRRATEAEAESAHRPRPPTQP